MALSCPCVQCVLRMFSLYVRCVHPVISLYVPYVLTNTDSCGVWLLWFSLTKHKEFWHFNDFKLILMTYSTQKIKNAQNYAKRIWLWLILVTRLYFSSIRSFPYQTGNSGSVQQNNRIFGIFITARKYSQYLFHDIKHKKEKLLKITQNEFGKTNFLIRVNFCQFRISLQSRLLRLSSKLQDFLHFWRPNPP